MEYISVYNVKEACVCERDYVIDPDFSSVG